MSTDTTSEESPWNAVHVDIIGIVVSYLKRKGLWSRDMRSLRALNKHWCASLNGYILEVRPHSSRVLRNADIQSLAKFTNLTALETTRFEGENFPGMKDRCNKLVKVLSKLPHLTHLRVRFLVDHIKETSVHLLKSVTGIDFGECQVVDSDVLSKISGLKIEELTGSFSPSALNDLISKMPSMQTLSTCRIYWESTADIQQFVANTKRLKAVSLSIQAHLLESRLTEMNNLVSLTIHSGNLATFNPLVGLHKLTSLTFDVIDGNLLNSSAFQSISRRLLLLEIDGSSHITRIPDHFLTEATVLESLSFVRCTLQNDLLEKLPDHSLKSLSFRECTGVNMVPLTVRCTSLKHLTILSHWFPNTQRGIFHPLRRLTSLKIQIMSDAASQFFYDIVPLTALDELAVTYTQRSSPKSGLERLECLLHLRSLALLNVYTEELEEILKMEVLTRLEELTVKAMVHKGYRHEAVRCIKAMKKKASHLKIKTGFC